MIQIFLSLLPHAFWFATPENEWKELFLGYLPRWLTVDDQKSLIGYYKGESSLLIPQNFLPWLAPIFWWSAFLLLLIGVMLCLNLIFRKQWTETEKLTYPIIQLPLEITKEDSISSLFTKRLFWIGFAIAGCIDIINNLNYLYPVVPGIPIRNINLGPLFTKKPWSAIGSTPMAFYPFVIGLGFFIPLDLSFSCWFFYLVWKAERVIGSMVGVQGLPGFPYNYVQAAGAYIAISAVAIFHSRRHLKVVIKSIFTQTKPQSKDSKDAIGYRVTIIGLLFSIGLLTVFCLKTGMSFSVILLFFGLYYAISIGFTRMRAELGPPVQDLYHAGPNHIIINLLGTRRINRESLMMLAFSHGFNRNYRCHPMPHQLEGLKMAERTNINIKRLVPAMLLATAVGTFVAFFMLLYISYDVGANNFRMSSVGRGHEAFNYMTRWLSYSTGANRIKLSFMGAGFTIVCLLMYLRMRFFWFPLHPVAYPLAGTWLGNWCWSSLFVSWALKGVVLKYGGLKLHRRVVPFFIGLILGEYVVGSLFNFIGSAVNIPTYAFWGSNY